MVVKESQRGWIQTWWADQTQAFHDRYFKGRRCAPNAAYNSELDPYLLRLLRRLRWWWPQLRNRAQSVLWEKWAKKKCWSTNFWGLTTAQAGHKWSLAIVDWERRRVDITSRLWCLQRSIPISNELLRYNRAPWLERWRNSSRFNSIFSPVVDKLVGWGKP